MEPIDPITEIRNASHQVNESHQLALADLFGDNAERVKITLIQEMGADDAGKFTIGLCVGARLMGNRVERHLAEQDQ